MRIPFTLLAVVAVVLLASPAFADDAKPGDQVAKEFTTQVGDKEVTTGYLLYLPKEYDKDEKKHWPLILFLHGAGERGDDIEVVKKHGPPKIVSGREEMQFIIVSPQCPRGQWWNVDVLAKLLDEVAKNFRVDADRVYVTGLSMGGFGTWALASKYPDRFAAAVPICGGGDPSQVAAMKNIPTWVFHGDQDRAVPLKRSQDMVEALKQAGGDVKLTVYEGVGHDSWTRTYDNEKLYEWMLSHKRKTEKKGK